MSDEYKLPFLYKIDGKNKERIWLIKVLDDEVITKSGEVGGKVIVNRRKYEGVNINKKNATTSFEQAKRVAERLWIKKLSKGYDPKTQKGIQLKKVVLNAQKKSGNVNTNLDKLLRQPQKEKQKENKRIQENGLLVDFETNIRPMHCQKWSDEDKVLKYFDFDEGVYVQPKLDGIRAIIRLEKVDDDYYCVMTSRQGKQFLFLKHLRESIKNLLYPKYKDIILDAELYFHNSKNIKTKERFNIIQKSCRTVSSSPFKDEELLQVYIFDIIDETKNQEERFQLLEKILKNNIDTNINRVQTFIVNDNEELETRNREFKGDNFEGTVVRAKDLMYESDKRSLRMRKYKEFQDEEYEIIGHFKKTGVADEQFVWICKNEKNKEFKVKPRGTKDQRLEWYKDRDEYIGQQLTVKFQELTKDGVPRFPVGIAIRNYE
jgi:ATP-dependent DNA ligase